MKVIVKEILSERRNSIVNSIKVQKVKLVTKDGREVEKEFVDKNLSIGDEVDFTLQHLTDRFSNRLKNIGIETELIGNYPWVYLRSINSIKWRKLSQVSAVLQPSFKEVRVVGSQTEREFLN